MLSCARGLLAGGMIEVVCECSDTGGDVIISFGPGIVCCLRPIYCLHFLASRLACTEIFHYDVVHVRCLGSIDKMIAVIASPHFVDLIACAIEVVKKMSACITRLLAEDEIDLETLSR